MLKINLLPPSRRSNEFPTWKLYRIVAYGLIVISIVTWGYNLAMFKYSEQKLADVQTEIAMVQVWQDRFDKTQLQNADINKRNTLVKVLSKDRILWSRSLAELGNVTPMGCWLQSVKQNNNKITIVGSSLKLEYILNFMDALENKLNLGTVRLHETNEVQENNITVTNFTIDIQRSGVK